MTQHRVCQEGGRSPVRGGEPDRTIHVERTATSSGCVHCGLSSEVAAALLGRGGLMCGMSVPSREAGTHGSGRFLRCTGAQRCDGPLTIKARATPSRAGPSRATWGVAPPRPVTSPPRRRLGTDRKLPAAVRRRRRLRFLPRRT